MGAAFSPVDHMKKMTRKLMLFMKPLIREWMDGEKSEGVMNYYSNIFENNNRF